MAMSERGSANGFRNMPDDALQFDLALCLYSKFRRVSVTIGRSKGLAESMELGNLFYWVGPERMYFHYCLALSLIYIGIIYRSVVL